jgi:hypothetical protein
MTQTSTKARKAAQTQPGESRPVGIGERCPACGNHARLENGDCVTCSARQAAKAREPIAYKRF